MAKKKGPEMYEGKPVLVAANSDKLDAAVEKFKADYPDIPLEAPYVVRVKGKKVKSEAFYRCTEVGVVLLHDNVEVLGEHAFYGCTCLTSITIPDSVTKIEANAFKDCTGLTNISIPASVTEIGDYAFASCSSLTSITIPISVTSIGNMVFYGCTGLTNIKIDPANPIYDSREDCNAIIATKSCTLIMGCQCTVIPNSVTKIGDYAFKDCTSLTSIIIPASVTEIGSVSFSGCTSLTSIKVDPANPIFDSREECNAIIETKTGSLIWGCQDTVIPTTVTKISQYAFLGCTGLKSIIIPDSVTEIENGAFAKCTGLTSITIPASVTKIGRIAFSGCTGLTSINIPDSVTEIGSRAFAVCRGLANIVAPDSLKHKYEIRMNALAHHIAKKYCDCNNENLQALFPLIEKLKKNGYQGLTEIDKQVIERISDEIFDNEEEFYYVDSLKNIIVDDADGEEVFSSCRAGRFEQEAVDSQFDKSFPYTIVAHFSWPDNMLVGEFESIGEFDESNLKFTTKEVPFLEGKFVDRLCYYDEEILVDANADESDAVHLCVYKLEGDNYVELVDFDFGQL